eukprot:4215329-Prymnesium_polylepis.1
MELPSVKVMVEVARVFEASAWPAPPAFEQRGGCAMADERHRQFHMAIGHSQMQWCHVAQVPSTLALIITLDGMPHATAVDICTGLQQQLCQLAPPRVARSVQRREAIKAFTATLAHHARLLLDRGALLDHCACSERALGPSLRCGRTRWQNEVAHVARRGRWKVPQWVGCTPGSAVGRFRS